MSSLYFDVFYRDHGAQRGMQQLGSTAAQTAQHFDKFKAASTLGLIAAGAALVKFGTSSVKAYSEAAESQKRLAFAFTKFPALADTNQKALQNLNSALQLKTKFDDDAIASGQAILAQFKLTGSQITQVTPLLLDYADATGKDIPAAAQDVGKALLGNAKALKNIGISYHATGDTAKDFANVTDLMRQKIGGFAEEEGKTAAGQLAILKNQFGELQEAVGARLLPILNAGTKQLTGFVVGLGQSADVIIPLAGGLAGLAGTIWLAQKAQSAWNITVGLNKGLAATAVKGLGALKLAFTGVEISADASGKAMRIAQLSIPVVGVALFALTSIMAHFVEKSGAGTQNATDFSSAMESVTGQVTLATAALNNNVRATAAKALQDAGAFDQAKALGISLADVTSAALGQKDAIERVNAVLVPAVNLSRTQNKAQADVQATAAGLAKTLGVVGDAARTDAAAERDRRAALVQVKAPTVTMADLTEDLAGKNKALASQLQQVINKFTILKQGALDQAQADMAWQDAIDNVSASVKQNGHSLDIHTEKGRANRTALINMMTALNDKTTADVKNAGVVRKGETATDAYSRTLRVATTDTKRGEAQIRAAAKAAGLNKDAVDAMIKKYLKTPKQVATDVKANGVKKTVNDIKSVQDRMNNLHNKTVHINFATNATQVANVMVPAASGNRFVRIKVPLNAGGGLIQGPGTGTSDSILGVGHDGIPTSRVSRGEFVVNQKQTSKHLGLLKAINDGVGGYADGGVVRRSVDVDMGGVPNSAARLPGAANRFIHNFSAVAGGIIGAVLGNALGSGGLGDPAHVSNPRGLTSYHGGTFTRLFVANLKAAERAAGRPYVICQGGFRPTTSYSGSTHNMDAIDAHVDYILLRAFRRFVGAMGDRTGLGNWAPHMHGVPAPGHGYGSPSARAQWADYQRRGGASQSPRSPWGLATGGVARQPGMYQLAERGPERVLDARRTERLDRVLSGQGVGGGAAIVVNVNAPNFVGSNKELAAAIFQIAQTGELTKSIRRVGVKV